MAILRNAIFTMVLLLFSASAWCGEYVNPKASQARVKGNDWVSIQRYSDYWMRNSDNTFVSKDSVSKDSPENTHWLLVDVEFQKPCKATTIIDMVKKEYPNSTDRVPLSNKYWRTSLSMSIYLNLKKEGKTEEAEKLLADTEKKVPDLYDLLEKYVVHPQYDCSYQTRVNVTYFGAFGLELKTDSQFPKVIEDMTGVERKMEMFPGEVVPVLFIIPEGAETWDVWVSK